jgi:protein TonB
LTPDRYGCIKKHLMKRKNNLLSLMLCVSLVFHGSIFFLFSVYSVNYPMPAQSAAPFAEDAFALVNLALIEPTAPEAPPPLSPPPPPELSAALPDDIAAIGPAENFVSLEEILPVNAGLSPPVETVSSVATSQTGEAALSAAYVKRNYDYIQRRIGEKLVYPPQAKRTGIQGAAEISFTIQKDGRVSDVTVVSSSGSELLDTAAVEAIYAASPFRPPPAQARLSIPVAFRLRELESGRCNRIRAGHGLFFGPYPTPFIVIHFLNFPHPPDKAFFVQIIPAHPAYLSIRRQGMIYTAVHMGKPAVGHDLPQFPAEKPFRNGPLGFTQVLLDKGIHGVKYRPVFGPDNFQVIPFGYRMGEEPGHEVDATTFTIA